MTVLARCATAQTSAAVISSDAILRLRPNSHSSAKLACFARDGAHVLVAGHGYHTGPPRSQVEQVGGYAAVRLREIRLRFPTDCPGWIRAWVSPEGEVSMWRPIATAPRDGTRVDLLYPHPRGRMINCFWHVRTRTWMWRTPRWQGDTLLPEHQWDLVQRG